MNLDTLEILLDSLAENGYSTEILEAYEKPFKIRVYWQKESFELVIAGNRLLFPKKLRVRPVSFRRKKHWFEFFNLHESMDDALRKVSKN